MDSKNHEELFYRICKIFGVVVGALSDWNERQSFFSDASFSKRMEHHLLNIQKLSLLPSGEDSKGGNHVRKRNRVYYIITESSGYGGYYTESIVHISGLDELTKAMHRYNMLGRLETERIKKQSLDEYDKYRGRDYYHLWRYELSNENNVTPQKVSLYNADSEGFEADDGIFEVVKTPEGRYVETGRVIPWDDLNEYVREQGKCSEDGGFNSFDGVML